ncbi:hypothetical protein [Reinekea marinisedimentorum]|uniref:RiboL-PSP-HEPN domain-containing protein n=1 Tax=Reinekea marinisedimentorum TaxID=230495 RepID=A0A4R3HYV5_9GAMM|nr:hypothetical protein [Reinekea marinisedimentorum]TCS36679.1 hypothetical protein BCF53_1231 [Reinekea marinisedimentorum]
MEDNGIYGSAALFESLIDDVGNNFKVLESNKKSQTYRRNAIRAVFGFIEGVSTVLLNEVIIKRRKISNKLSSKEIKVLDGSETDLVQRLKKSFTSYTKLHGFNFTLNTSSSGYDDFKKAKQIRNNLTHPKRYRDIEISESDMSIIAGGYLWVKSEFMRIMQEMINFNLQKMQPEDREAFNKLLSNENQN